MSAGHARLGPSNPRWVYCPGSVDAESKYEDVPGAAAIDGTGSHLLLELCIIEEFRAETYIGKVIGLDDRENPQGWIVDIERAERVQMGLDYIARRKRELSEQFPGALIIVEAEQKVDIGGASGRTDYWGTVDITFKVLEGGTCKFIEVADYKDGRGYVNEKGNTQLHSYLFGAMRPYVCSGPDLVRPFNKQTFPVRMTIIQPKTKTPIRYVDEWSGGIVDFYERVLEPATKATDQEGAPLNAGKHCQWCKASKKKGGHCVTAETESFNKVKSMSTDIIATDGSFFELVNQSINSVESMTPEQLTALIDAKDSYMNIFKNAEDEIEKRISMGENIPGFKMLPGRATRKWSNDTETLVKKLKSRKMKQDDIYKMSLITPAQLEKSKMTDKQKSDILAEFCVTVDGKDKLTKVSYEKETASEMFADIALQTDTNVSQSTPSEIPDFF